MNKHKEVLHHKLLNILTLINLSAEGEKISAIQKEGILNLINLAALFIKYEDVLLGKKPKICMSKIDLREILEIIFLINNKKIKRNNINFIIPENIFFVDGDRNSIKDGIALITNKLLDLTKHIEFKFNKDNKTLVISHREKLKLKKISLWHAFGEKNIDNDEIAFPLALEILGKDRISFDQKTNSIIILFN